MKFQDGLGTWHAASETIQLLAGPATASIMVAVSQDTLARLAKVRRLDEAGCRSTFERYREYFCWLASRKHEHGEIGPFCTILITPDDLSDAKPSWPGNSPPRGLAKP